MQYPLETGNYVLIVLGAVLSLLGPYIIYRTVLEIRKKRALAETIQLQQWGSHLLNVVIGALFVFAGVLFVVNNLRGNPFA